MYRYELLVRKWLNVREQQPFPQTKYGTNIRLEAQGCNPQLCCSPFRMPHCISLWHIYVQTDNGHHGDTLTSCTGGLSQESSGRGLKLTPHMHLAPMLRINGAIPLLPLPALIGVARDSLTTLPVISHHCAQYNWTHTLHWWVPQSAISPVPDRVAISQTHTWSTWNLVGTTDGRVTIAE